MCDHPPDDTYSDGTTDECALCGDTVRYFDAKQDQWVDGQPEPAMTWTEEGWL